MAERPREARFVLINVQLYSLNHKIAFWATLWSIRGNISALPESFNAKKLCSRVLWRVSVTGNVRTSSIACWKARDRLSIHDNWTFFASSYGFRCYKQILVEVGIFSKGWVTLSASFRWKGTSPTNFCWCQKAGVITLHTVSKYRP